MGVRKQQTSRVWRFPCITPYIYIYIYIDLLIYLQLPMVQKFYSFIKNMVLCWNSDSWSRLRFIWFGDNWDSIVYFDPRYAPVILSWSVVGSAQAVVLPVASFAAWSRAHCCFFQLWQKLSQAPPVKGHHTCTSQQVHMAKTAQPPG